jgi:hypothetical protein
VNALDVYALKSRARARRLRTKPQKRRAQWHALNLSACRCFGHVPGQPRREVLSGHEYVWRDCMRCRRPATGEAPTLGAVLRHCYPPGTYAAIQKQKSPFAKLIASVKSAGFMPMTVRA